MNGVNSHSDPRYLMVTACMDCDQDASTQYVPDPGVPSSKSILRDNRRIADHVAGVQGTVYTDESYKEFGGVHHHYDDTEWSKRNQLNIDRITQSSALNKVQNANAEYREVWSPENAAADRFLVNQSKHYLNQPLNIINGSPEFLSYLENIHDCISYKFRYGNIGAEARTLPKKPGYDKTMFDDPIPFKKLVPAQPEPYWNGDVTEGQMIRNTVDPAWKLAVRDSAQKVAADHYKYESYSDKSILFALTLAVLMVMPLTLSNSS